MALLTPDDLKNVLFSETRVGKKGYVQDEVDNFLDSAADGVTELHRQLADLRQRLDLATRQAANVVKTQSLPVVVGDAVAAVPQVPAAVEQAAQPSFATMAKMLKAAEDTAAQLVADAKTQADALVGDARTQAAGVAASAQMDAQKAVADAQVKAGAVLANANAVKDQLLAEGAKAKSDILGAVEQQRQKIQAEVDRLLGLHQQVQSALSSAVAAAQQALPQPGAPGTPTTGSVTLS